MSGLCAEDKALLRVKVGVSEALGADPVLAAVEQIVAREVAAAEQRGREDNEDHGLCYVHGSKALEAYVAEHVARFKAEAVAAIEADRLVAIRERWTGPHTGRYSATTEARDYEDVLYLLSLIATQTAETTPSSAQLKEK